MGIFDFFKRRPRLPNSEFTSDQIKRAFLHAFPEGPYQVARETDELGQILGFRISRSNTLTILQSAKMLFILAPNHQTTWAISKLMGIAERKLQFELSPSDAEIVHAYAATAPRTEDDNASEMGL